MNVNCIVTMGLVPEIKYLVYCILYLVIYTIHLSSHVYKKVHKLHENAIMCNILCYHTMLSYQTTSFALLRIKFHKSITVSS